MVDQTGDPRALGDVGLPGQRALPQQPHQRVLPCCLDCPRTTRHRERPRAPRRSRPAAPADPPAAATGRQPTHPPSHARRRDRRTASRHALSTRAERRTARRNPSQALEAVMQRCSRAGSGSGRQARRADHFFGAPFPVRSRRRTQGGSRTSRNPGGHLNGWCSHCRRRGGSRLSARHVRKPARAAAWPTTSATCLALTPTDTTHIYMPIGILLCHEHSSAAG
jgi:hypothetical protein